MSEKAAARSRRIVTEPIRPLLVQLTFSAMIGNLAMHLMGIVDTFYISRLGTVELAAASFVIPIHTLYISLGLGIGMGMSSLNSRLIGESRFADSSRLIRDGLLFAGMFAVTAALIGSLFMTPLFRLLGADERTLPYIRDYMSILLVALPPLMLVVIGNSTFRSMGNIRMSATLAACLSVLNITIDPLLIFGIGPFPQMGIRGAATATFLSATITLLISLYVLGFYEKLLDLAMPRWQHLKSNWAQILSIGVPAMGANIMTPLAAAIMTAMVARFGDVVVAGFGVGSRVETISLIFVMALSSTVPMFIGQNLGAGRNDRAYTALMGSLKFVLVFQFVIYAVLWLLGDTIAATFSANPEVTTVIKTYLLILPLTYGAHGVVVLCMVALNVMRKPRIALLLTFTRLMVLYIPLAWVGAQLGGLKGLFMGAALGNVLACGFAWTMIQRVCQELGLKPDSNPIAT
ncbi:MAG: MATE family efflux transporter [Pseudohongiellaceae bacterium]